jgi:sec-independent protein translocase protein TatA
MGGLKPWHIIVIALIFVLLFGAKRLPDAARSLGRSLRIIKAETKGLIDDDNNVAEKAEPQQARHPLNGEVQQQPGQYQQPGYQQPQYQQQPPQYQQPQPYQQPNGQQPGYQQQPQQPPAAPFVDPVQRNKDR